MPTALDNIDIPNSTFFDIDTYIPDEILANISLPCTLDNIVGDHSKPSTTSSVNFPYNATFNNCTVNFINK